MENINIIINDLTNIFSKTQQKGVNISYSNSRGGEITLLTNDNIFSLLDNENSKLFKKFMAVIDRHDLNYDFISYGNIVIYEE